MTPFTVKVFKLFLCIFACEKCFCTPLDLSHEAKVLLESHGINNTNSDVMKVAKNFVLERREAKNNITLIERERERERSDAFHYKGKLDAMQIEKKGESDVLWLVRVRSAVEFFQSEHGSDAQYSSQDWTNLKALKNRHERSCLFRELNFKWIFANKQHVHAVADLTNRIQNNPFLGTTDKFSKLIATATSDLSVSIHNYLLTPGKGQYDVEFSTRYAETNEAVKEFWRTFAFAENIVKKVTPTFTTVSTEPSTP